ncbi:MAG TPA: squalene synthase HpnC [Solirubrobacteraceae bacterium]|nr:squalene synthase HpnC [Solirubrobacteraceae bacterium]
MTATREPVPVAAQAPTREAVMAQARSENFPVASYLLGRRERSHLLAIYGFARLVDDLGDEAPGDRLALLDWLEAELDRLYAGAPVEHPVMRSLAPTVAACHLPAEPFRRLIEANRRDQTVTRYETFDQLLDYCRLSAAPVGELVLHVFAAASPDRIRLSDRICAGLQVTEHLQDIVEDHSRGRVYLPQEDLRSFGCSESDLTASGEGGEAVRRLIAFEVDRARSLLAEGAPLARTLAPRARAAVASFVAGGRAALDGLGRSGPHNSKRAFVSAWLQAVRGR